MHSCIYYIIYVVHLYIYNFFQCCVDSFCLLSWNAPFVLYIASVYRRMEFLNTSFCRFCVAFLGCLLIDSVLIIWKKFNRAGSIELVKILINAEQMSGYQPSLQQKFIPRRLICIPSHFAGGQTMTMTISHSNSRKLSTHTFHYRIANKQQYKTSCHLSFAWILPLATRAFVLSGPDERSVRQKCHLSVNTHASHRQ